MEKEGLYKAGSGSVPETKSASSLVLDFLPSRTARKKNVSCLSQGILVAA